MAGSGGRPPSTSIFIGNVGFTAVEEELSTLFKQVGPLKSFRLVTDRETGKPKGYAFAEYFDVPTAQSAQRNLNGTDLNGRTLRVDFADSEKHSSEHRGPPKPMIVGKDIAQGAGQTMAAALGGAGGAGQQQITDALSKMTRAQIFEIMNQMKALIQQNPGQARQILVQNPQLTKALFQAQILLGMVMPAPAANSPPQGMAAPAGQQPGQHLPAPIQLQPPGQQPQYAPQPGPQPGQPFGQPAYHQQPQPVPQGSFAPQQPMPRPQSMPAPIAGPHPYSGAPAQPMPAPHALQPPGSLPTPPMLPVPGQHMANPRQQQGPQDPRQQGLSDPRQQASLDPRQQAPTIDPRQQAPTIDPRQQAPHDPRLQAAQVPRQQAPHNPRQMQASQPLPTAVINTRQQPAGSAAMAGYPPAGQSGPLDPRQQAPQQPPPQQPQPGQNLGHAEQQALLRQVMNLTPQQIELLPEVQRQQVLELQRQLRAQVGMPG